MDDKTYLKKEIASCKRKQNIRHLLSDGITGMAAGATAALLLEGISVFVPFYYVHVWAFVSIGMGVLAGGIRAFYRRSSMQKAALEMDASGFEERILTAYENLQKEDLVAKMQREDAIRQLREHKDWIRISVKPEKRRVLALVLSLFLTVVLAVIPSTAKEQAGERHDILREAKEKAKEVEKTLEALENVDQSGLTEEQKLALQELMESLKLSGKEFKQADTKEALFSAEQKLSYKYEQASEALGAQTLADAGISISQEGQQAGGESSTQTPETGTASGTSSESSGTQSGTESGSGQQGNGTNSTESAAGSENGTGDGNQPGSESGTGNGAGNGQEEGNGTGSGEGSGQGNGNGSGEGRGTGSSNTTHDYVSVPNQLGDDKSITGDKGDSKDSDYYKAQNGLAWEGDHVDLDSVIKAYQKDAYEGISQGKYPSGMEPVIRDYFENLNE